MCENYLIWILSLGRRTVREYLQSRWLATASWFQRHCSLPTTTSWPGWTTLKLHSLPAVPPSGDGPGSIRFWAAKFCFQKCQIFSVFWWVEQGRFWQSCQLCLSPSHYRLERNSLSASAKHSWIYDAVVQFVYPHGTCQGVSYFKPVKIQLSWTLEFATWFVSAIIFAVWPFNKVHRVDCDTVKLPNQGPRVFGIIRRHIEVQLGSASVMTLRSTVWPWIRFALRTHKLTLKRLCSLWVNRESPPHTLVLVCLKIWKLIKE